MNVTRLKINKVWILSLLAVLGFFPPLTAAEWEKYSLSSAAFYYTKSTVPQGTEVRIKVIAVGNPASPKVLEYYGPVGVLAKNQRSWNEVTPGQVLSFVLAKNMKVGIEVSGVNFWRKAETLTAKDGYHEMTFEGGWVLHVKLVGQEF